MTADQSRKLKLTDRVGWRDSTSDLGTIIATEWSAVTIRWDNGKSSTYHHNDMGEVWIAPKQTG